jgi:hypothetical protein
MQVRIEFPAIGFDRGHTALLERFEKVLFNANDACP